MLAALVSRCLKDKARIRTDGPVTGIASGGGPISGPVADPDGALSAVAARREAEVRDMLLQRYFSSMSSARQVILPFLCFCRLFPSKTSVSATTEVTTVTLTP